MDSKRLIIAMAVSLAILLGWQYFINSMAKKYNWGPPAGQTPTEAVQSTQGQASAPTPVTGAQAATGATPAEAAGLKVLSQNPPQVVTLGSESMGDKTYSLGIRTQSQGASIAAV